MSKKHKKNNQQNPNKSNRKEFIASRQLAGETIHSIWALIFLAIALLLGLAGFSLAGNAGEYIFKFLFSLFGWGYSLLPLTFIGISANFLLNKDERRLYAPTLWGSLLFFLSALGFINTAFGINGGSVGILAGYPSAWFGNIAWSIVLFIASVIGVIIVFDQPLHLFNEKNKEENDESEEVKVKIAPQSIPEEKAGKEEPTEQEEKGDPQSKSGFSIFPQKVRQPIKSNGTVKKFADYKAPPLELLKSSVEKPNAGDLRANANIIKRTLESFGIAVEMGEINIGPKVTRYTLRPAEGIKLTKITALNQDLALALSAHPIRIEAPIPGKPYVGIEVPNKTAAIVRLGNLMAYPEFSESGQLGFCVGRDVTGDLITGNIEKMPHLLVAGATGSGKSIMLHSILISLLYKNSPQTLKFILIDPKRVELSAYNGLPHLIAPVITQGKKALGVFRWAIAEMEKRYEILLKAGARDVQSYNKKNVENPLSFIVIVVDEMADLMVAYGRDVENAIVRLAQMARATGIHLILSTQRPSVEVITGLIKANITSRIALQVASQVDSRTILDTAGAEKLLGGGDLLFISAELSKPKRIQGAYIAEDEIKKVTDYIRDNNEDYIDVNQEGLPFESNLGETGNENHDMFEEYAENQDDDELLQEAIETIKQTQKASASLLQRKLKIGYARAARLLDIMEEKGIVGPGDGAKAREVFVSRDDTSETN
jgi:S-DNA-T family DNA segregation ATPase FtsK/SpoIIIE